MTQGKSANARFALVVVLPPASASETMSASIGTGSVIPRQFVPLSVNTNSHPLHRYDRGECQITTGIPHWLRKPSDQCLIRLIRYATTQAGLHIRREVVRGHSAVCLYCLPAWLAAKSQRS